ncbi:MAG: HD-GYP domain-containing protein [Lachnospiraceae bacterium]|nr:HD-GYP domain-containing protein [Lachnospiraceae bacterium]
MSLLSTKDLVPGMVTAEAVKTKTGQLIVNEGVALDRRLIERLHFYSIREVEVIESDVDEDKAEEERLAAIAAEETAKRIAEEAAAKEAAAIEEARRIAEEEAKRKKEEEEKAKAAPKKHEEFVRQSSASYVQKVVMSDKFKAFQISYTQNCEELKKAFENYQRDHILAPKTLMLTVLEILNEHKFTTIELFDVLHNIRTIEDSIYAHSLNVAYIARVLGKWCKFDKEEIDDLTIAGLFHDIGKTLIPKTILDKPGKLTSQEYEIVKMHSQMGYDLLRGSGLNARILNAILNHHERCDGSGYPNKKGDDELDEFTMVIAIADVYDAMTSARSYRHSLCPFMVIAEFESDGLQKYKPSVILPFLNRVANTYQHNRVRLSDNRIGTIVLLNDKQLSRPILQMKDGTFLDLLKEPSDVYIEALI